MTENSLNGLNEMLFKQMDRLDSASKEDLADEIARSKAIRDVGETIIANGKLMVDASREMTAAGEAVKVPKGLLGA